MLFSRCLGDFISRVRSIHSNRHEDRTWAFYCKTDNRIGGRCYYSGWRNSFDHPLIYQCPYGVLTGAINNIYIYTHYIASCFRYIGLVFRYVYLGFTFLSGAVSVTKVHFPIYLLSPGCHKFCFYTK